MEDRCVCCGAIIPEGRQVCIACEALGARPMKMELPCRLGDSVWAIGNRGGRKVAELGEVSEMYFTGNMELCIVVKRIARGRWGQRVFATEEEALEAIERGRS